MKKVAIITLYGNFNLGNKLQNYAVQRYFEDMGYECRTIMHVDMNKAPVSPKSTLKKIYHACFDSPQKRQIKHLQRERTKRFKLFSDKYIATGEMIDFKKVPTDFGDRYDYYVVGSDQVWRNWNRDNDQVNFFMLRFTSKEKRVTIAPSFGTSSIDNEDENIYREGLMGFSDISVREEAGAEIVRRLTGKKAEVLLDPTMLINTGAWSEIEKSPSWYVESEFILVYILGAKTDAVSNYLNEVSTKYGLQIIEVFNTKEPERYMTTPDEFVYLVNHSAMVVTDSFHACVFSILYKKPFVVFEREEATMGKIGSRIDTLLSKFGLSDRKLNSVSRSDPFKISYEFRDSILEIERKKAQNFYRHMQKDA